MALLQLTAQLPETCRPTISVVHVNHQLRPSADQEAEAVANAAAELGVPVYTHKWEKELHPKSGIENAARQERYRFFKQVMKENNIQKLLTGHHKNDQAETVLMRLVRGSALPQLQGILESRSLFADGSERVIRPLLEVSKAELYQYAEENQLLFFEDESNLELDYTRNRYRHLIMPMLKKEHEEVEDHLADAAAQLQDLIKITTPLIEEKAKEALIFYEKGVKLNREKLIAEPESWRRLILKQLLDQLYDPSEQFYKKKHIELLNEWLTSTKANSTLDLPGHFKGIKEYSEFWIRQVLPEVEKSGSDLERIDERIELPMGEWRTLPYGASIGLFRSTDLPEIKRTKTAILYFDRQAVKVPLTIRHRQNGDRIKLKGMSGSKKISRILIDQKIPTAERKKAMVVEDRNQEILWVVGLKESQFSILPASDRVQYVLILTEKNEENDD